MPPEVSHDRGVRKEYAAGKDTTAIAGAHRLPNAYQLLMLELPVPP